MLSTFWGASGRAFWEAFWGHFGAGWPNGARWGLEGSRAIFTDKTHAIVRVTPISLESGEPRMLKHCKNTYKNEVPFRQGTRSRFHWPNSPPEPLQDKPVWGINTIHYTCVYIYMCIGY